MRPATSKPEMILEAAGGLVLKHGLRGTSMEAIARAAGIAKPTLYAYYPDKDAVFTALAERLIGGWRQDFLAALRGDGDIVARVGAALTARCKGAMKLLAGSPHAAELYSGNDRIFGPRIRGYDDELLAGLEAEINDAGIARARFLAQLLLASASGIGQKAQSPAELGPALRLIAERLIRPELPSR